MCTTHRTGHADNYLEAIETYRIVWKTVSAAKLQLGLKPLTAAGRTNETAMLPFGTAAAGFSGHYDSEVACTAVDIDPNLSPED